MNDEKFHFLGLVINGETIMISRQMMMKSLEKERRGELNYFNNIIVYHGTRA